MGFSSQLCWPYVTFTLRYDGRCELYEMFLFLIYLFHWYTFCCTTHPAASNISSQLFIRYVECCTRSDMGRVSVDQQFLVQFQRSVHRSDVIQCKQADSQLNDFDLITLSGFFFLFYFINSSCGERWNWDWTALPKTLRRCWSSKRRCKSNGMMEQRVSLYSTAIWSASQSKRCFVFWYLNWYLLHIINSFDFLPFAY